MRTDLQTLDCVTRVQATANNFPWISFGDKALITMANAISDELRREDTVAWEAPWLDVDDYNELCAFRNACFDAICQVLRDREVDITEVVKCP